MLAYYKAVNDHNRVAFADRVPAAAGPDQATYVGVEACTTCHPAPREVWNSDAPRARVRDARRRSSRSSTSSAWAAT